MRLSSILLSTAFLAASGAAWAQTPPPAADAPPPAPMVQPGETPPPPPAMAQSGETPPPPPHPMMGGHGPHGGMSSSTGFHLRMGEDRELKVDCGDMPLAECIETARPLMDMAGN